MERELMIGTLGQVMPSSTRAEVREEWGRTFRSQASKSDGVSSLETTGLGIKV